MLYKETAINRIPVEVGKPSAPGSLLRVLGKFFALAVVIGATIGGGILYTPGKIAALVPNAWLYMAVWVFRRQQCTAWRDGVRRTRRNDPAERRSLSIRPTRAPRVRVSVSGHTGDNGVAINTAKYADRATLPDFTAGP